jgi:hypothetical protein
MNTIQPLPTPPAEISVTTPISPALERVKRVLFQPFDLGKWFVIGFCAWLAFLGEAGGGGGGGGFHVPGGGGGHGHGGDFRHEFDQIRSYVMENLHWIVPLAVGVVLLLIALGLLFVWLSSRGKFMFLHCVALDKAEVAVPWNKFVREGNSLFWFRAALGLAGFVVVAPVLAVAGILVARMIASSAWTGPGILALVGLGFALILIAIVFAIIRKLTMDFVVPIMFLRGKRCLEAWGEFRTLLKANLGQFALYLLFQIVLNLAIGVMVLAFMIVTCCFCCLLLLPYVGTVVLLPVLVFSQSYSLYYLAQFGRDYDVFPVGEPPRMPGPTLA